MNRAMRWASAAALLAGSASRLLDYYKVPPPGFLDGFLSVCLFVAAAGFLGYKKERRP